MNEYVSETSDATRVVRAEGSINLRDMGGYRGIDGRQILWHRLYRSGKLDMLTTDGVQRVDALGVKTLVDLRYPDELRTAPTNIAAFGKARIIPWSPPENSSASDFSSVVSHEPQSRDQWKQSLADTSGEEMYQLMLNRYPRYLESHRNSYRALLDALIAGESPVLFHCSAGKDRTGVGAALILTLLGVDRNLIIEDYLQTNRELGDHLEGWMAGGAAPANNVGDLVDVLSDIPREFAQPLFRADQRYLENLFVQVEKLWGGFENYAHQQLGLTDERLKQLQNKLLTD